MAIQTRPVFRMAPIDKSISFLRVPVKIESEEQHALSAQLRHHVFVRIYRGVLFWRGPFPMSVLCVCVCFSVNVCACLRVCAACALCSAAPPYFCAHKSYRAVLVRAVSNVCCVCVCVCGPVCERVRKSETE